MAAAIDGVVTLPEAVLVVPSSAMAAGTKGELIFVCISRVLAVRENALVIRGDMALPEAVNVLGFIVTDLAIRGTVRPVE